MDSNSPIGVFDSGLGGLTVLKELRRLLPHENFIFVGDSARAPYGSRTPEEIISFLQQFMDYFQSRGVKMAVCACNTMTSYGYPVIKDKTSFALVPMNPAIIPAVKASANKHIGVIATEATIKKGMHKQAASNLDPQIKVFGVGCPKFVPLIETGHIYDDAIDEAVQEYADKFKTSDIHSLILGCTHYPLVIDEIKKYYGSRVRVIDSPKIVASFLRDVLSKNNLLNSQNSEGSTQFYLSDITKNFEKISKKFFGNKISLEHKVL